MNKILTITKNILLILNILLLILFCNKIYFEGFSMFLYTCILVFTTFISIKDLIQKNNINDKYNLLFIVVELFQILIFIRALYDPAFIYNSSKHMEIIKNFNEYLDNYKMINFWYLSQNLIYFMVMLSLLFIYREINIKTRKPSKYSLISVVCMFISIATIIPTLECLNNQIDKIPYLLFNIILLGVEIFELIRNNHKKREWILYVAFLFNLFAFISIFV